MSVVKRPAASRTERALDAIEDHAEAIREVVAGRPVRDVDALRDVVAPATAAVSSVLGAVWCAIMAPDLWPVALSFSVLSGMQASRLVHNLSGSP